MLTSQNKKYLRKLGMEYRSLFQIGKDGLSDNLMDTCLLYTSDAADE